MERLILAPMSLESNYTFLTLLLQLPTDHLPSKLSPYNPSLSK